MSQNPGNIDGAISPLFAVNVNVVSWASEVNEESIVLSCQSNLSADCLLPQWEVMGGESERVSFRFFLQTAPTAASLRRERDG